MVSPALWGLLVGGIITAHPLPSTETYMLEDTTAVWLTNPIHQVFSTDSFVIPRTVEHLRKNLFFLSPELTKQRGVHNEAAIKPVREQIHVVVRMSKSQWPLYVLLLSLLFFTYLWHFFSRPVREMFRALLRIRIAEQLYREEGNALYLHHVLLSVLFVVQGGLLLYHLSEYFYKEATLPWLGFWGFLACCGLIAALAFLKHLSLKVVAWALPDIPVISFFNFHIGLINRIAGIFLLPLLVLITYGPSSLMPLFIIITLTVISALLLYVYWRGIIIAAPYIRFHKFYFFLYLCTLEIAPVLIVVRIISNIILE